MGCRSAARQAGRMSPIPLEPVGSRSCKTANPRGLEAMMARLLFVYFLPAGNSGPAVKREGIRTVLTWLPDPVTIPTELDAALDNSLLNPGTSYNTRRDQQLAYLINFGTRWSELAVGERE